MILQHLCSINSPSELIRTINLFYLYIYIYIYIYTHTHTCISVTLPNLQSVMNFSMTINTGLCTYSQ